MSRSPSRRLQTFVLVQGYTTATASASCASHPDGSNIALWSCVLIRRRASERTRTPLPKGAPADASDRNALARLYGIVVMAYAAPNYQTYFKNDRFSDVNIEIVEDVEPGQKRKRSLTIPAHSMVLIPFSAYCKAKLEHWSKMPQASDRGVVGNIWRWITRSSEGPNKAKHTVRLLVPLRQSDIAVCLIRAMYQEPPVLSDLDQQQLLQLLLLADRFEVPKVQAAVIDALSALSEEALEWETAVGLLDQPISSINHDSFTTIIQVAESKLMQLLGDLENVWADEQLQEKLCHLPHSVLLHLVNHDQTRVANESTVVYTILQWWDHQPSSYRVPHKQHLDQLMQHVRMQHLSLLYISTCMMNNFSVLSCLSSRQLALACSCTDFHSRRSLQAAQHQQLMQYPAWTAARRPASSRPQQLEWNLSLTEVCDAVDHSLRSHRQEVAPLKSPTTVLQGHTIQLELCVIQADGVVNAPYTDSDPGTELQLGLYLMLPQLEEGSVCRVAFNIIIEAGVVLGRLQNDVCYPAGTSIFTYDTRGWGHDNIVTFSAVNDWSDVEAKLKRLGLVHPDGCLHCKVQILEMA